MNKFAKSLILMGWILLWLLTVGLIGAYCFFISIGVRDEALQNCFIAATTFTFATFPTMVRDFLKTAEQ